MSRIGKLPIPVRPGVEVKLETDQVHVKGARGNLTEKIVSLTSIEVTRDQIVVARADDSMPAKAAHGLMRSLIANMVVGVTDGFSKTLDLVGVGYRAAASSHEVTLNVGYSHPVILAVPAGVEVKAEGTTRLVVSGASKQKVGQFAAEIRRVRPPEPYKGKGIRYADEKIRRKVGKAAAAG